MKPQMTEKDKIDFSDEVKIEWINTLKKIINSEVKNQLKNLSVEIYSDVIITGVDVDSNTVSCKDISTKELYTDVKNKTGISLEEVTTGTVGRVYRANGAFKIYLGLIN